MFGGIRGCLQTSVEESRKLMSMKRMATVGIAASAIGGAGMTARAVSKHRNARYQQIPKSY